MSLLERALADAKTTSLLVEARRVVAAARTDAPTPSYLQARVARDQPLPEVALRRVTLHCVIEGRYVRRDCSKLSSMMALLLGMEGGIDGGGIPRDIFRIILDMLMPRWDPLRRGLAGEEGQLRA